MFLEKILAILTFLNYFIQIQQLENFMHKNEVNKNLQIKVIKAYVQCLDPCNFTGGGTVAFEVEVLE